MCEGLVILGNLFVELKALFDEGGRKQRQKAFLSHLIIERRVL